MLRGGAVGELVARIGEQAGAGPSCATRSPRALNDPSLELAYWLPESRALRRRRRADRSSCPDAGPGARPTRSTLEGEPVAVLVHDPLLLDEPELIEAVAAAAALALENERLDAELRAKVGELRDSRARSALGRACRAPPPRARPPRRSPAAAGLAGARPAPRANRGARRPRGARSGCSTAPATELERALEELRELARGMHPAVLSDRGLDPAVEALAGRAPLPVEIVGAARRADARADRAGRLLRRLRGAHQRRQVRPCEPAVVRLGRDERPGRGRGRRRRRRRRRPGRGAGCAGSPIASRRSAADSRSTQRRGRAPRCIARIPCE